MITTRLGWFTFSSMTTTRLEEFTILSMAAARFGGGAIVTLIITRVGGPDVSAATSAFSGVLTELTPQGSSVGQHIHIIRW